MVFSETNHGKLLTRAYFQFIKPERVDEKNNVQEKISKQGTDNERLPTKAISQWASKQCEHDPRCRLEHSIVGLDLGDILLCLRLNGHVGVDVVADLLGVVEVDLAGLVEVQPLGGDGN